MEQQILDLEKKYWDAMVNFDFETVNKLTYFPCIVSSKNGVKSIDEATFKQMFDSGKNVKRKITSINNVLTQSVNQSTASIGYLIEMDTEIEGKKISSKCACASSWIQVNGEWKCNLHSETDIEEKEINS